MSIELDKNGLEILDKQECLKLLSTTRIGRIALSMSARPVILPVAFALTPSGIVVRTGEGTKLSAVVSNELVAFEADVVDESTRSGWSVAVTGLAREVTDLQELAQLEKLVLIPWIGVAHASTYLVISTDEITGRRISTHGMAVAPS